MNKCEFCQGVARKSQTVCNKCDEELKIESQAFFAELNKQAAKRKCRKCNNPLTPDRYFHCHDCSNPLDREAEDIVMECIESYDLDEVKKEFKSPVQRVQVSKICTDCKEEQPIENYSKKKEGHKFRTCSHCRECDKIRHKRYYENTKKYKETHCGTC